MNTTVKTCGVVGSMALLVAAFVAQGNPGEDNKSAAVGAKAGSTAAAQAPVGMDFVTHNQVLIDATPAAVWPHIVDTNSWKKVGNRKRVAGEAGKVGERLAVVSKTDPSDIFYYIENAEMVPGKRRTIRIQAVDGSLIGYSSWVLFEQGGKTRVEYDVYCWDTLPAGKEGGSAAEVAAAKRAYLKENIQRFDDEFAALKRIVEEKKKSAAH